MKFLFLILILITTYIALNIGFRIIHEHTADCSHGNCYFSNLNLSARAIFKPSSNIPSENVVYVSLGGGLDGSRIHTLNSKICYTFPNVEEISATNLGLVRITQNAFSNCRNLKKLDLSNNGLKELNLGEFAKSDSLIELNIVNNQFTVINEVELVNKFPGLEDVWMCPNDKIGTVRLNEIAKYFEANRINVNELDFC